MLKSRAGIAVGLLIAMSANLTATAEENPSNIKLDLIWETDGFANPESALVVKEANTIYVSNVEGQPKDKDGKGFISKVNLDGTIAELKWVTGFNAPKGMALVNGKLYVADIDQLAAIDIATGKVTKRFKAEGAQFLNDTASDDNGRIYVSDMETDTIWRLDSDTFEPWLQSDELENPNGLNVQGDNLIVASWGKMTDGFATEVPGHMKKVSLSDKSITSIGTAEPVGNLDGLEPDGRGGYYVTDWMAGKLFHFDTEGKVELLLTLSQGSADIGIDGDTIYIPMMMDNTLFAYKVSH